MTVEIFTFCENATQKNGTLSLLGAFDHWQGKDFPMFMDRFCIVLRIRQPGESLSGKCQLVFIDPDGDFALQPTELEVKGSVTSWIFSNRNVNLPKPGTYHAVVMADEKVIGSIPLFVSSVPSLAPSPSPCLN